MLLTACYECGTEFPNSEETCPDCGYPVDDLMTEAIPVQESAARRVARWFVRYRILRVIVVLAVYLGLLAWGAHVSRSEASRMRTEPPGTDW